MFASCRKSDPPADAGIASEEDGGGPDGGASWSPLPWTSTVADPVGVVEARFCGEADTVWLDVVRYGPAQEALRLGVPVRDGAYGVIEREAFTSPADELTILRPCPGGPLITEEVFTRTATVNQLRASPTDSGVAVVLHCTSASAGQQTSWSVSTSTWSILRVGCSERCRGVGAGVLKRVQMAPPLRVESDVCTSGALEATDIVCPFLPDLHPRAPLLASICRRVSDSAERLRVARVVGDETMLVELPDHDVSSFVALPDRAAFLVQSASTGPTAGARHELIEIDLSSGATTSTVVAALSDVVVKLRASQRLGPGRMLVAADLVEELHAPLGVSRVGVVLDEAFEILGWLPLGVWEQVAFSRGRYYGIRRASTGDGGVALTLEELAVRPFPLGR